jgi:hypothetical protein
MRRALRVFLVALSAVALLGGTAVPIDAQVPPVPVPIPPPPETPEAPDLPPDYDPALEALEPITLQVCIAEAIATDILPPIQGGLIPLGINPGAYVKPIRAGLINYCVALLP